MLRWGSEVMMQAVWWQYTAYVVLAVMYGGILGSFLNVCIHRLPLDESVVRPPSHCPGCNRFLAWYENVPWLSMLIQRGKCRGCGMRISWRYFIIESFTGGLAGWAWWVFGPSPMLVVCVLLGAALLVASAIDIQHYIIPDEITLPGIVIGVALSTWWPELHGAQTWWMGLKASVVGVLVGGGVIYLTAILGDAAFKKESMGGGDIKLLAMCGALLGWSKVLVAFFVSPVFAAVIGIWMRLRTGDPGTLEGHALKRLATNLSRRWETGNEMIPYGPFLALGSWIALLRGDAIIQYLMRGS